MLASVTSTNAFLITGAAAIVTMQPAHMIVTDGYVYVAQGVIREIGAMVTGRPAAIIASDPTCAVIKADGQVVLPGLINTHHHLYQTLTRAYPPVMNAALFPWLQNLYPIWAKLDEAAIRLSTLIGMAELMLSGCTTTVDHHYVFPQGVSECLIDVQIEAARDIGMRFHACRGSMNLSQKDGGLPPDSVVQTTDVILRDSERLIDAYHDRAPGALTQIALAPCSPFSVTTDLMRLTAELAQAKGVRLHTHLAETLDEEDFCLQRFGGRPVDYLEQVGWLHDGVWLAHGIHFSAAEIARLGAARVGVAHCPSSNMRLGSGIANIPALRNAGCPVSLAVDGSASNDTSHLLAEARQALLLGRLARGAESMTVMDALHLATVGGAACLGRTDIGTLAPGKAADLAIFALHDIGYAGAGDPVGALLLCHPTRVETLIINGRVVVEAGQLRTLELSSTLAAHRRKAQTMQAA